MKSLRLVMAAGALVLFGACKVEVSVEIDVGSDGTGVVRATAALDEEAVDAIGDPEEQLELDDLVDAGWEVDHPDEPGESGAEIVVTRRFDSPDELPLLVEDLGGADGAFKQFAVDQRRGLFKTRTSLRGTVDLTAGLAAFTDPALREALGGDPSEAPLGVTEEQLEKRLGAPVDRAFALQVAAILPGQTQGNAPVSTGDAAVWAPRFGEQLAIQAEAEQWNIRTVGLLALAIAAGAGSVGLALSRVRSGRPRRRFGNAP